jgi:predicted extracellular nuclease
MRHLGRLAASLAVLAASLVWSASALGAGNVVISQIYGGGGNTGAQYQNDYVELFNRSLVLVDLSGWSIQYTSATGTGNFGSATNLITPISGFIGPGQYVLVQEAAGAGAGSPLPSPFIPDSTPINMSASGGKVALVNTTTALGCNGGSTPCPPAALAQIVDLVGYDGANFFEGAAPAPTLSNTTAGLRAADGCTDTDNNGADFFAAAPSPRTSASPTIFCPTDSAPSVSSSAPGNGATGVDPSANVSVTFSEPVSVADGWFTITCATSGGHEGAVTGGPSTWTIDPNADFTPGESCTVTITAADVTDVDTDDPPDTMTSNYSFSFTVALPPVEIAQIQGAAHTSPLTGQVVTTEGVVTAKRTNGFYLQDPTPDLDPATSDAVFVFTSSAPTVAVGDAVRVSARVQEFRPGGAPSANLTTTELASPSVTVLSAGNLLPTPVTIGAGGLVPPNMVVEDDAAGSVETSGVFDPAVDGIDFWESLEGMRLVFPSAVAVGPTATTFGETPIVNDDANASVRTPRGGLLLQANDFNPERVIADDAIVPLPDLDVGDHYSGPLVGVLDYNFGNFFLEVTSAVTGVDAGLQQEVTSTQTGRQLSIATFNVENLDPGDGAAKFDRLAGLIVGHLKSPDLVTLEEVQDNNGPVDDGTTNADVTLNTLVAAISAAGGPTYQYRYIDPVDDQDGGEPGGNIRIAFLFRTDRGLEFVDAPGAGPTTANSVIAAPDGPHLQYSPGRIDPTNAAWTTSRKPLAAEFKLRGRTFFLIGDHFNSKGGDDPIMGRFQPPTRSSEAQRHQQAQVENDFIDSILAVDPNANIVVLGDLNDFQFSETVQILTAGGILHDLIDTLPLDERYSYEFEGNAQVLDHILVSTNLADRVPLDFDVVHVNAEFADQASDHDPSVVRVTLNRPPTVHAGGPYAVDEGGTITLSASGSDPDGDALTYAWDLDNNGTFETPGQSVSFSRPDGPATLVVSARVSDGDATAAESTSVTVRNVAPTAIFSAPAQVFAGDAFTIALTGLFDPSGPDTAAGFTYSFDCGSGYGPFGSASSRSCPTTDTGTPTVRGRIRDKDGAVGEYTASVSVIVTVDSLCALTQRVTSKPAIASALCDKLRQGAYAEYAELVDAQTGKAIKPADAALLKRLVSRL